MNASRTCDPRRRSLLGLLASSALCRTVPAQAHAPFGRVDPPQPAPALQLRGDDARHYDWPSRLRGRITAVQLMFTGCSATCPIQGALFAAVARQLPAGEIALLSISIDPHGDDPAALRAWLQRFGSQAAWSAAVPRAADLDRLLDFLGGAGAGVDRHTAHVYLFDRQARLRFRTQELPGARHLVELLGRLRSEG